MLWLNSLYTDVPYHNKIHHIYVEKAIICMWYKWEYDIWAARWHDVLHTGTPRNGDEMIAATVTTVILKVCNWLTNKDAEQIEHRIIWTIFQKRWNIDDIQAPIADADLYAVWSPWEVYIKNAAKLFVEDCLSKWITSPTYKEIMNFWTDWQEKFFKYLTSITWKENEVYLTDTANKIFPYFPSNRDKVRYLREKNPNILVSIIVNEWKNYFWKELFNLK